MLREHVGTETIDLVYLDPPFNSKATYNVLFQEHTGEQSAAQISVFEDTWHWSQESELAMHDLTTGSDAPEELINLIQAFKDFLGTSDMMAYLTMMAPRLLELHRVLKRSGSLYLHCDPTASHHIKLLLDSIFGIENYRSEIIWKRSSAHSDTKQGRKQYGRIHDVIFFYTKDDSWTWNTQYTDYDPNYVTEFYKYVEPGTGRRYRLDNLTGPGGAAKGNPKYEVMGVSRYWRYKKEKMEQLIKEGRIIQTKPGGVPAYKRYLDEMPGVSLQDIWTDVRPIQSQAMERLGYPTQKPGALLERIIKTSSNEGDTVLDPFCGCGTTITVAELLRRKWIGMDITHLAISLIRHRLNDTFQKELSPYEVVGDPKDLKGAQALALEDRYQFQWWAVGMINGRPAQDKKKGKDTGIDGYIYFFDDIREKAKQIIISVKSGHVSVKDIRDLKGVLDREKAAIGVFITLEEPTRDMNTEAVSAGFYESLFFKEQKYPKLQILTIKEILEGKRVMYPQAQTGIGTFKKAERQIKKKEEQEGLF